jgi:hypothetical protein
MTLIEFTAVKEAISQAERFVSLARKAIQNKNESGPCRKRSAMKRASLDLSAALVEVRKNPHRTY